MRSSRWFLFLAVPGLVLLPGAARAAGCDSWTRATDTVVRFRGTLRAVEGLKASDATVSLVGWGNRDQHLAVTIAVESVEPNPRVRQGATLKLGIEDLERSFGRGARVGATRELELVARTCDGTFWRFTELRPRSPAQPGHFEGWLEAGMTFRVPVRWDPELKETVLVDSLHLPMHYGGGIKWLNPEAVQQLGPERKCGYWVFEVVSEDRDNLGSNSYYASFNSRFLSLESMPPPCDGE